jgi:hypothetical protein
MSTDYNINETVDVAGLDNIKADLNLGLPQPFKTEGSNTLEIKPLKVDFDTDSHLKIDPLKADFGTDSHLKIDPLKLELQVDPLKTNSHLTLDLKPAVIDLCLTANIGKVPSVCIHQPYHHHFGFTLFGTEVWGFTLSGHQETVIEEIDRRPKTAWGAAVGSWPPQRPAHEHSAERPSRQVGGLRVRLEP